MVKTTKHRNQYFVVEIYNNVTFEKTYTKILGHGSGDNGKNINIDLF